MQSPGSATEIDNDYPDYVSNWRLQATNALNISRKRIKEYRFDDAPPV